MNVRNLLVAHGGGPTAVINASLAGVIREAQNQPDVDRVFAARHGIEGVLCDDLLDLTEMTSAELDRLERTPSSAIGSCRYKMSNDDYGRIVEVLDHRGIGYFLYNGGNDSMDTCLRMHEHISDIEVAGIPKTIDNDLAGTDHSPGFGSAARYYAVSTVELCLDAVALGIQVSILEVMGRNAGWLAASTSLARSVNPDFPLLILLPEKTFDEEAFLAAVERRWKEGRGFVVAASEGLTNRDGQVLGTAGGAVAVDAFGHRMPGGVGEHLSKLLRARLGIRARAEKPGLLGRASQALVSEVDRSEAAMCGARAVAELCAGRSGFMVGIERVSSEPYTARPHLVALTEVANIERKLPDEYIGDDGMNVVPEFESYCRPLLGTGPFGDYLQLDLR